MTLLAINQVAFGLGRGVLGATSDRMGIWTQGCSLRKCPGCTSRHTWLPDSGRRFSVESLIGLARSQTYPPQGLTVSGGEPTDQAEAVGVLVAAFRAEFPLAEVVLYTGLRWRILEALHKNLVDMLDVVVAGPYVRTLDATPMAGSSNQEVRLLTPLAKILYRDWQEWPIHALQVALAGKNRLVTVGIPNVARMSQVARSLGANDTTWESEGNRIQEKTS